MNRTVRDVMTQPVVTTDQRDTGAAAAPSLAELAAHLRRRLADYKAPRELVLAPIVRAANGKVDYKAVRAQALAALGVTTG